MKHPFFSIIVPTYNQAEYLGFALDTIRSQTFSDWEAVVVNDGSTDGTSKVMSDYAKRDHRIRLFHKENGGVASALNEGLKNARGEWICWLSSDDLFEPDKLEIHFQAIKQNPQIKFFQTHWYLLMEKTGKKVKTGLWLPTPEPEFQTLCFFRTNYVHGNAIAVHRSVFDKVGYFDEHYRQGQDFDMWLRISAYFQAHFINKRTCVTRIHEGQDTNSFPVGGVLDSARSCIEYLNKHRFQELFPLLDMTQLEEAKRAVITTVQLSFREDAFMYRTGFIPALVDRLIEWLTYDCPESVRRELLDFIDNATDIIMQTNLSPPIQEIQLRLKNRAKKTNNNKYKPYDFITECIAYSRQLIQAGELEKAYDIERFLDRVCSNQKDQSSDRFTPVLFGFLDNRDVLPINAAAIRNWEFAMGEKSIEIIRHKLTFICPRCEEEVKYNSNFRFKNSPQSKKLTCSYCKTGISFTETVFDEYFMENKTKNEVPVRIDKNRKVKISVFLRGSHALGGGTKIIYKHIQWLAFLGCEMTIYSLSLPPDWIKLPGQFIQVRNFSEVEPDEANLAIAFSIFDIPTLLTKYDTSQIVHFCQGYEGYHYGSDYETIRADKYIFSKLHSIPVPAIVVSKHLKDLFFEKFNKKADLVPNGIDHSIFKPQPQIKKERHSILFIGNPYHPLKGFMFLARAIKGIQSGDSRIDDLKLYLVADLLKEKEEHITVDFANDMNCDIIIRNNLSGNEVAQLMNRVGLVVCSSIYEGFSLPVLEAMACGTPVISTNNMGAESFCIDNYNAFILKYGDIERFKHIIVAILNDEIREDNISFNALKTSRTYSELNSLQAFIKAYSRLLGTTFDDHLVQQLQAEYLHASYSITKTISKLGKERNKYPLDTRESQRILYADERKYVSIVMVVNKLKSVEKCLSVIRKNTYYPHEIIFIDVSPEDETKVYLKNLVQSNPNYYRVGIKKYSDIAKAINRGIELATGDYLLLMNDDNIVPEQWLTGLIECAEMDDTIGLVGPAITREKNRKKVPAVPGNYSADSAGNGKRTICAGALLYLPQRLLLWNPMLIKRALFEKIGLLNEQFRSCEFAGYDYCLRAQEAGYVVMMANDVLIRLTGNRAAGNYLSDHAEFMELDQQLFKEKWPDVDPNQLRAKSKRLTDVNTRFYEQGHIALETGEIDKARSLFNEILTTNPFDGRALFGLVLCARQQEDNKTALHYLHRILEIYPDYAAAYNQSGIISAEIGDLKNAKILFSVASEKDPDFIEAQRNLGEIMLAMENYEGSVQTFTEILKNHPEDVQTLLRMAQLHAEVGNDNQAKKYIEEALIHDPDNQLAQQFLNSPST